MCAVQSDYCCSLLVAETGDVSHFLFCITLFSLGTWKSRGWCCSPAVLALLGIAGR